MQQAGSVYSNWIVLNQLISRPAYQSGQFRPNFEWWFANVLTYGVGMYYCTLALDSGCATNGS